MSTIHVQPITLTGWNDTRTSGIELWVFSNQDWVDAAGIPHGYGDINTRVWTQRVTGLTVNTTLKTLGIPMFDLVSTRDALRGGTVRLNFFIVAVVGTSVIPIAEMPDTQNGIQIPATMASTSGCTPVGTCASWSDIIVYNSPSPSLPIDSYPTRDEVNRLIAGITAGSTFAPVNASYLVQTGGGGLINAQVMGSLGTGLVKNTTATGVQSIAVAGTDYQAPIGVTSPLTFVANTVAMPAAAAGQNGYLTSADWTTFNGKQAALGFTPENLANKNATNGYAGLASGKLTLSQMQEVMGLSDLSDVSNALGAGTTVPKGTFAGITSNQSIQWNGSDFVPFTPGTVTSVGISTDAPWMTVASSPVISTGTITMNRATGLTQNQFLGTPDGSNGVVGLRSIVLADIPTITVAKGGTNLTSLGTAYQVLGVNSGATAAVYLSIVAGSNITITPSGTQISIAAAASAPHNLLSATHLDTAVPIPSVTRGDIITGQGSGTPLWARLAKGTQYQTLHGGVNEPLWDAVHLDQSTAVTGILPALNGGTGFDGSAAANGRVPIGNGTGFTLAALTAGSNITITNSAGGIQIDASGSLGTNWDALTSPASANLSLSMAAKTTTFTWGSATSTVDLFVLKDGASNTGTGHVLEVNTASSSAAKPVGFFAGGTSNGVEMSTAGVLAAVGTGGITATALNGVAANGIQVRTSAGNFTSRSVAPGVGITVSNGDGVSGNPTVTCDLSTLVANQTLWDSSQASRTLTAGLSGATDPVITFSNGAVDLTTGTLRQGGLDVVLTSRTINTGTGLTGGGSLISDRTFAVDQAFSPTWTGIHTFTPAARSSGAAPYLTINAPADTNLTLDTEAIGVSFVGATRQHADGTTQTNQREIVFAKPTYSAAGTSVITNAATVAITGCPAAGSNMTLTNAYSLWIQAGGFMVGAKTTNFWQDSHPTVMINRLNDRLMIGGATDNSGLFTGGTLDWMETLVSNTTKLSQVAVLDTIGTIAILGASRASDLGAASGGVIGLMGFAKNDDATFGSSAYGAYFEAWHLTSALHTVGFELDIVNKAVTAGSVVPFSMFPSNLAGGAWVASGGGRAGATNASVALAFVNNGARFDRGLVMGATSLTGTDGTGTGSAPAIVMAQGHQLLWIKSDATTRTTLDSDFFTPVSGFAFRTDNLQFKDSGNIATNGSYASGVWTFNTATTVFTNVAPFFPQMSIVATNNTAGAAGYVLYGRARSANATGTTAATSTTAVVGTSTLFTTEFAVGDTIEISGQQRVISQITDNTHLTVTVAFSPATGAGATPVRCKVPAAVLNGDTLGNMIFQGYSNAAYNNSSVILAIADAAPSGADVKSALTFSTGGASMTERIRITSSGMTNLYMGGAVASAAAIVPTGNRFHVTGTTNITSITSTGIIAGTIITIIFDGILTFTDGSNLKLAGNFVTTADDTITLLYDGTNWFELCRSVN